MRVGKTIERSSGCRDTRREIEEAGQAEPLSSAVDVHLKTCSRCERFFDEQLKLRQIVSSLGTVAAPNDFEFRLRARLASEKRGAQQPFTIGNLSFGFRSTAVAAILLMFGAGLLALALRPGTNESLTASASINDAKTDSIKPQSGSSAGSQVGSTSNGIASPLAVAAHADQPNEANARLNSRATRDRQGRANRPGLRATQVALAGDRFKTRDMGSTAAKVVRADDLIAAAGHTVFPIDASPQALKVSLDNGRGTSKTISVPGVSFGSQRVLTQSPSPLLASSRGAW